MKWICYQDQEISRVGLLEDEKVYPITNATGDVCSIIGKNDLSEGDPIPLSHLKLNAPIRRPTKIICVGLNYRDHAEEQKKTPPSNPKLFLKAPNCVVGPQDHIVHPGAPHELDYEIELGVLIGKAGAFISKETALSHVFGYTIFLDMTARDCQKTEEQWFRAKSFYSFGPMGPIVRQDSTLNSPQLALELSVNGELRQKSHTNQLIFDIPTLISYISQIIPLEVGDLISTGTPGGVGAYQNPPAFLQPGDRLTAKIETLGTLEIDVISRS